MTTGVCRKTRQTCKCELLSFEDILEQIIKPEALKKIIPMLDEHIENFLRVKLSKEFRFVEIIGGVLGFIIGLVQVLLTYLTS